MSSLQRSRSLRKPSASSTTSDSSLRKIEPEPRNGSPSRLPIKPLTRSATVSSSTSTSTRTLRSSQTLSSGLTRTTSVRQAAASTRQPTTSHEPTKRETSRYPPSTAATRPRPVARPTSSDGPTTQTRRVPSHSRAKSTTTTTRTAPVLRPPSGHGSSTTTRTRSSRTSSPDEKPGAPTHSRTAPVLRPPSQHGPNGTTTSMRTRSTRTTSPVEKPGAPTQAPRLRPAFSTLQQHYSPAKSSAPKPLTSTFLAPPSPSKLPANVAASAETSKLQTELLQLHLLHRDATVVDVEWRASAKQKLGDRFSRLAVANQEIDEKERAGIERENVLALRSWASGGGLEERIQILDGMMSGLWTMGEPGGRYARVVRRFERWIDRVTEIEDARRSENLLLHDHDVLFIGDLDASWKDECAGLKRKLDGWKRQLGELGQVPDDEDTEHSSLKRMMEGSRILIHNMLDELNIMEGIEKDALDREDSWIERMNRDETGDDTPRAGAIWRVV